MKIEKICRDAFPPKSHRHTTPPAFSVPPHGSLELWQYDFLELDLLLLWPNVKRQLWQLLGRKKLAMDGPAGPTALESRLQPVAEESSENGHSKAALPNFIGGSQLEVRQR